MTEEREKKPVTEVPPSNGKEAPATPPQEPGEVEALKQELEATRAKAQEYLDSWKRTLAEFDNYRKRVAQQEEATRQRLRADVFKELLEIVDDLERALRDPNRPKRGKGHEWAEGIELIYRKIRGVLARHGVEEIPAAPGQPFDPYWHEVIGTVDADEAGVEEGHIVEVVRKGYRVGDLVIRPALVKVARA